MQPEDTPVLAEEVVASLAPERYPFWGWVDLAMVVGLLGGMIGAIFL